MTNDEPHDQGAGRTIRLPDDVTIKMLENEVFVLRRQLEGFAPYLKDGETPLARLERERRDNDSLMRLLAAATKRAEQAEASLPPDRREDKITP